MAQNTALLHAGNGAANKVEIGAADGSRGDADDGVIRLLNLWLGDIFQADVAHGVEDYCFHGGRISYRGGCRVAAAFNYPYEMRASSAPGRRKTPRAGQFRHYLRAPAAILDGAASQHPAMARPLWQGQIQISLVSLGVGIYPASNTARQIEFHQVDRATGERIHHQNVSATNDAPVEKIDIAKGYEYEKDKYIVIEPDELKKLRLPGQKTIEITQFCESSEIDPSFFEKPYFVVPKDELQAKSMAIIGEALRETGCVGLGEITFSGRAHLAALSAPIDTKAPGLMLYLMRYEEELRDRADYYTDTQKPAIDEKQLSLAKELIQHYRAPFEPDQFKDEYEVAVKALVDAKLENKPLPEPAPEPKRGKVINLMDALKLSLAAQEKKRGGAAETEKETKAPHGKSTKSNSSRRHSAA